MPIQYRYDPEKRLLQVRVHGTVTDAELLEYARTATADPTIEAEADELIDLRDVEIPDVETSTLKQVANLFHDSERAEQGVRIALVAGSDAAYGLARMYQAFRIDSSAEIQVFREMDAARGWLDPEDA